MAAGYRGTFVISVAETETDGVRAAPVTTLAIGSQWLWRGEGVRVDGPAEVLVLDGAEGGAELRRRAARSAARLIGAAPGCRPRAAAPGEEPRTASFTVTDGLASFRIAVISAAGGRGLLAVTGALPPRDTELSVIDLAVERRPWRGPAGAPANGAGMICFTPGTVIDTPEGPRPVEAIRPGDRVSTRDSGAQEVLWTGARRLSGARLYAMPALRPVRLRAGALGPGRPEHDLVLSPDHGLLLAGRQTGALFGTDEVLVAARDLIDGRAIVADSRLGEVTYIHLLTARHEVIRANGIATETFHPAAADPVALDPAGHAALCALIEGLAGDPFRYGGFARRSLTGAEAAILRHRAA